MRQSDHAEVFAASHVKGRPIVLYNIWDAGSAKVVAEAGAQALATGSWPLAAAQGYPDGEVIPLKLVETIVGRIVATVDLPLTVDFEAGYGDEPVVVAENVARIIALGAIGINFEDGIMGSGSLRPIAEQCRRIEAIRTRAELLGINLFINARTDLFLKAAGSEHHAALCDEAIARAHAFAKAGGSGFFAPGLVSETLIERLCNAIDQPVNIMKSAAAPPIARLAELGVARVSHGPVPFRHCMQLLRAEAEALNSDAAR